MNKLLAVSGLALLIVALVAANMTLFGGRRSGSGSGDVRLADSPPQTVRGEPLLLTPELDRAVPSRELLGTSTDPAASAHAVGGIAGVVLGAGGGGPLSGAAVRVTALEGVATTTDEHGAFRLLDLAPARRDVFVSAPGWVPALVRDVRIHAGELTRFQVMLERAESVCVEVRSAAGDAPGMPVPDAVVRLFPGGASSWVFLDSTELANSGISARTGADGRACIDQIRAGSYLALVSAPEHPVWRGDVMFHAQDDVVRIVLPPGATIAGHVLRSDGGPGSGHVLIGPAERVTHPAFYYGLDHVPVGERGEFHLWGVPAGEHHLIALLADGEIAMTEKALSVSAGETLEVELSAAGTATIRGRVTDQAGAPLNGARVKLSANALLHPRAKTVPGFRGALLEQERRVAVTGADGRFVLERVPAAAGRVEVSADLEGYARATAAPTVRAGQDLTWNPVLSACDSVVAGHFVAPFSGLGGITVVAKQEAFENGGATFMGTTRPDGGFELAVPSTGTYMLTASTRDLTPPCTIEPPRIEGVRAGNREVEFVIEPRSFLRVHAVDEEGHGVGSLEVSLFDDVEQSFEPARVAHSSDGRYDVPVDPGRHLFASLCSSGFEPKEVWDLERVLDQVIEVELVRSGEDVPVRVVSADGEPIGGASVSLAWFGERGAYPRHSTIVPVVRTDASGEGVLRGVPLRAPRDFVVAPGVRDAPPLVHLAGAQLRSEGGLLVLPIPRSTPVEILLADRGGRPAGGACVILTQAGLPVTPRAFPGLRRVGSKDAVDPTLPVQGKLDLHLEPGTYTLQYQPGDALAGDVRLFDFTVLPDRANSFTFEVEG